MVNIIGIIKPHTLTSSDDAIRNQVRDIVPLLIYELTIVLKLIFFQT